MSLIQAGDTAQMACLFERHHLALFRYLFQLTRNRTLSEDLTQDVFLRAIKYVATYKAEYSFRTWLFGMARNARYDAGRKTRGEVLDIDLSAFESDEVRPEERVMQQQDGILLQQALNSLSEDKREVLELSRFQEMDYEAIAKILQCEVGTARVRAYRALNELRNKFMKLQRRQLA